MRKPENVIESPVCLSLWGKRAGPPFVGTNQFHISFLPQALHARLQQFGDPMAARSFHGFREIMDWPSGLGGPHSFYHRKTHGHHR
ncbi:hypothetical protein V1291_004565 [Nitrobacteraceae bacterium AZCC 1564]